MCNNNIIICFEVSELEYCHIRRQPHFYIEYLNCSFCIGVVSLLILIINMICLLLVLRYYKGLKMLKRLTEEVVIPIPYHHAVSSTCYFIFIGETVSVYFLHFRCHSTSARRICMSDLVATSIFYLTIQIILSKFICYPNNFGKFITDFNSTLIMAGILSIYHNLTCNLYAQALQYIIKCKASI